MKNKGFTLIEIMLMTLLLAVLAVIAVPTVLNIMKSSREILYKTQIKSIKHAAKTYMANLNLPNDSTIVVTIGDLKKAGLLKIDISNPKTNEKFDDCINIEIYKHDNLYEYYIDELSNNSCNSNLDYKFILIGSLNKTVVKNSSYIDPGIIIQDSEGQNLDTNNVKVDIIRMKNDNIIQNLTDINYNDLNSWIDFNDYYIYKLIYKYNTGSEVISVTRNLIVTDQTNINCQISLDGVTLENGWTIGNRNTHITLLSTVPDGIQYSLTNVDVVSYTNDATLTLENDGIYELYGYIKDSDGNQVACINNGLKAKFELENPTCNITIKGEQNNGWYVGSATAKLNTYEISSIEQKGLNLTNTEEYNDTVKLQLTESGTVYGFIKDELEKEASCSKSFQIDPTTEITPSISGISNGAEYIENTATTNTVLMSASVIPTTTLSGYRYQWYKDGNIIDGAISTSYTASESGIYNLKVVSGSGVSGFSNNYKVVISN